MEPFGLTQLLVTSDSRSLIDQTYSNCPENIKSVHVPKIELNDHFPVVVIIIFLRKCITLYLIGHSNILMRTIS